jgi:hypothetical protein
MTARVLFIGFVTFCQLLVACNRDFKSNGLAFDSNVWKSGNLRERGRMTNDLLSKNLLTGKSSKEVFELLGKPENTMNNGTMEYSTDPGSWMSGANDGPWIHYLNIEFDNAKERVSKAFITD